MRVALDDLSFTTTPLADMTVGGNGDEFTRDPILGLHVTDFDYDSTETWILIALHPDPDVHTFIVDQVDYRQHTYGVGYWSVGDGHEVATIADAITAAIDLHDDHLATLRMRSDD